MNTKKFVHAIIQDIINIFSFLKLSIVDCYWHHCTIVHARQMKSMAYCDGWQAATVCVPLLVLGTPHCFD